MESRMISLDDLYKNYQNLAPGEVILDVRTADEWELVHIPGSLNIPHDKVGEHFEQLKKYKKVFIHCKMGGRAKKAFDTLVDLGLDNIFCLSDVGMMAWIDEEHPTEKGP